MWIAGIAFFIIFLLLCSWRMESERPRTHGSAGWCPVWPLFKKGMMKRRGLLVGDWKGLVPVHYEQTHAITFGATGGGKGTTAVLPNLLSYPYVFLLDPGGENTAVASKHWRAAGYEFGCINFFGMHTDAPWELPTQGFNPLDLLDPGSFNFAADALVIADMLIGRSGKESEASSFFKNTARGHLRDFIVHCKTAEPAARQNLATVFAYPRAAAGRFPRAALPDHLIGVSIHMAIRRASPRWPRASVRRHSRKERLAPYAVPATGLFRSRSRIRLHRIAQAHHLVRSGIAA